MREWVDGGWEGGEWVANRAGVVLHAPPTFFPINMPGEIWVGWVMGGRVNNRWVEKAWECGERVGVWRRGGWWMDDEWVDG